MKPQDHEKRPLPRGVDLEKRRYIGFARQPVVDPKRHLVTGDRTSRDGDPIQAYVPFRRPWRDA